MVQIQNVIANTRRHYFSTEAENEYNTNFLYPELLFCPVSIQKQKVQHNKFRSNISTMS